MKINKLKVLDNLRVTTNCKIPIYNDTTNTSFPTGPSIINTQLGYIGNIIYKQSTQELCYNTGSEWLCLDGGTGPIVPDLHPFRVEEESFGGNTLYNVKYNTNPPNGPYAQPGVLDPLNNTVNFLVGSNFINSPSAEPTRMFFYKQTSDEEGAFRAGTTTGNQWDISELGQNSFAVNTDTRAIGTNTSCMGNDNTVRGLNSSITGGNGNTINDDSNNSIVGSGTTNILTSAVRTGIVAGSENFASATENSFIGAGNQNQIENSNNNGIVSASSSGIKENSTNSVIGGGSGHEINESQNSGIGAGANNQFNQSNNAFIGSGDACIVNLSNFSAIGGGNQNLISRSDYSFIGAGQRNRINSDGIPAGATTGNITYSAIGAGNFNTIQGIGEGNFIGGGGSNTINSGVDEIDPNIRGINAIVAGNNNRIGEAITDMDDSILNYSSFILGGTQNTILSNFSLIGGGLGNNINIDSDYSFIGGGGNNSISRSEYSVISSGSNNLINPDIITVSAPYFPSGNYNLLLNGSDNVIVGNNSTINLGDLNQITAPQQDFESGTNVNINNYIGTGNKNTIISSLGCSILSGAYAQQYTVTPPVFKSAHKITNAVNSTIIGGARNVIQGRGSRSAQLGDAQVPPVPTPVDNTGTGELINSFCDIIMSGNANRIFAEDGDSSLVGAVSGGNFIGNSIVVDNDDTNSPPNLIVRGDYYTADFNSRNLDGSNEGPFLSFNDSNRNGITVGSNNNPPFGDIRGNLEIRSSINCFALSGAGNRVQGSEGSGIVCGVSRNINNGEYAYLLNNQIIECRSSCILAGSENILDNCENSCVLAGNNLTNGPVSPKTGNDNFAVTQNFRTTGTVEHSAFVINQSTLNDSPYYVVIQDSSITSVDLPDVSNAATNNGTPVALDTRNNGRTIIIKNISGANININAVGTGPSVTTTITNLSGGSANSYNLVNGDTKRFVYYNDGTTPTPNQTWHVFN